MLPLRSLVLGASRRRVQADTMGPRRARLQIESLETRDLPASFFGGPAVLVGPVAGWSVDAWHAAAADPALRLAPVRSFGVNAVESNIEANAVAPDAVAPNGYEPNAAEQNLYEENVFAGNTAFADGRPFAFTPLALFVEHGPMFLGAGNDFEHTDPAFAMHEPGSPGGDRPPLFADLEAPPPDSSASPAATTQLVPAGLHAVPRPVINPADAPPDPAAHGAANTPSGFVAAPLPDWLTSVSVQRLGTIAASAAGVAANLSEAYTSVVVGVPAPAEVSVPPGSTADSIASAPPAAPWLADLLTPSTTLLVTEPLVAWQRLSAEATGWSKAVVEQAVGWLASPWVAGVALTMAAAGVVGWRRRQPPAERESLAVPGVTGPRQLT